jgi:hypothetical protein
LISGLFGAELTSVLTVECPFVAGITGMKVYLSGGAVFLLVTLASLTASAKLCAPNDAHKLRKMISLVDADHSISFDSNGCLNAGSASRDGLQGRLKRVAEDSVRIDLHFQHGPVVVDLDGETRSVDLDFSPNPLMGVTSGYADFPAVWPNEGGADARDVEAEAVLVYINNTLPFGTQFITFVHEVLGHGYLALTDWKNALHPQADGDISGIEADAAGRILRNVSSRERESARIQYNLFFADALEEFVSYGIPRGSPFIATWEKNVEENKQKHIAGFISDSAISPRMGRASNFVH